MTSFSHFDSTAPENNLSNIPLFTENNMSNERIMTHGNQLLTHDSFDYNHARNDFKRIVSLSNLRYGKYND